MCCKKTETSLQIFNEYVVVLLKFMLINEWRIGISVYSAEYKPRIVNFHIK
jgi:hypothetical protein